LRTALVVEAFTWILDDISGAVMSNVGKAVGTLVGLAVGAVEGSLVGIKVGCGVGRAQKGDTSACEKFVPSFLHAGSKQVNP
jgi:hypothetical protein